MRSARTSSLLELDDSEPVAAESESDEADVRTSVIAAATPKLSPLAVTAHKSEVVEQDVDEDSQAERRPRRSSAKAHTGTEAVDSSETEREHSHDSAPTSSASTLPLNRLSVPHSLALLLKCKFDVAACLLYSIIFIDINFTTTVVFVFCSYLLRFRVPIGSEAGDRQVTRNGPVRERTGCQCARLDDRLE